MLLGGLLYTVKDIMSKEFVKVKAEETINEVLNKMLKFSKDEVLVVNDSDKLIGIFTKNDLARLKREEKNFLTEEIKNYINNDVITIEPKVSARDARNIMIEKGIGRIPVVYEDNIIGVLTSNNIRDSFYIKIDEMFELQNNIMDNIHEAICICDEFAIVRYWNKSAEKLYGVAGEEIVGKHISEIFPNALTLKALREGIRIDNMYHEPVEGKSVFLSVVPIYDKNGKIIAVVSTDIDVTDVFELSSQLEKEKKKVELLQEAYNRELSSNYSFSSIMGKNKKIIESIAISQKVAHTTASVLITGESGTGKEVFAKAIHDASGRIGNFVAVNCSAIPEHLLESELFGYVEGAFTGAIKKGKIGRFEFANNGTIFLDEIGDMPIEMQAKLLRVLQDGIIYRLGSEKAVQTNARIIAATNKNLKKLIKEDKFRDDLFYRLAVVQIELPPLRERKEDIKELVNLFVNQISQKEEIKISSIDKAVYSILSGYKWEGNIRELKNVIQRMVVLSVDEKISIDSIPEYIVENSKVEKNEENEENEYDLQRKIEALERKTISEVMEMTKGNKQKAAEILNVKRSTLYYKLNQYKL